VKGEPREREREHLHPPLIRHAYLPLYKVAHAPVFIDDTKSVRTDTHRHLNFKRRGDILIFPRRRRYTKKRIHPRESERGKTIEDVHASIIIK